MGQLGEVWVYVQHRGGTIAEASLEVLGKARLLAQKLGVPVAGVLAGNNIGPLAGQPQRYGADKVYVVQAPFLENYTTCAYARALCGVIQQHRPEIFLLAATPQGRDLAPRIASTLRVGLTADCTDLKIGSYTDPKTKKKFQDILLQIRPAWGGNIIATIVNPETRPQMATIREGIMKLPAMGPETAGDIISLTPAAADDSMQTTVIEHQTVEPTVNLKNAKVIVAGGAGVGTKENFELVRKLAHVLGAEVGATRAAVDAGFVNHDHQVGQTGMTVRPKLYIACGISGAVQHLAGMEESGKIIAVNTDPEAPILQLAHYAIIGDLREVIPKIVQTYKTLSH